MHIHMYVHVLRHQGHESGLVLFQISYDNIAMFTEPKYQIQRNNLILRFHH